MMSHEIDGKIVDMCPDDLHKLIGISKQGCRPRNWEPDMQTANAVRAILNQWERGDLLFTEAKYQILEALGFKPDNCVEIK